MKERSTNVELPKATCMWSHHHARRGVRVLVGVHLRCANARRYARTLRKGLSRRQERWYECRCEDSAAGLLQAMGDAGSCSARVPCRVFVPLDDAGMEKVVLAADETAVVRYLGQKPQARATP